MFTYGRRLDYEVGVFTSPESIPATQISNFWLRYGNFTSARQKLRRETNKSNYTHIDITHLINVNWTNLRIVVSLLDGIYQPRKRFCQ